MRKIYMMVIVRIRLRVPLVCYQWIKATRREVR